LLLGVALFVIATLNLNAFAVGLAPLFAGLGIVTVTMTKAPVRAKWFEIQWLLFWIILLVGVVLLVLEMVPPESGS